jgi:tetratricopeptide (TPR) repeat protein
MILGCSESKKNYLSDGEKLLKSSDGDKAKIEKAIELFKNELQINPNSIQAVIYLASAYSRINKNDSAKIIISRVIDKNKKEMADLYKLRGSTNFILKDYDASIEDFEKSIQYNSENIQLYNQIVLTKLWKTYYKNGKWKDFTEEDISYLIEEVYPENIEKPSIDEFRNIYKHN